MKSHGVGRRLTPVIQVIGENAQFAVLVGQDIDHTINRNTRRSIITHYLHNISGEGGGWAMGQ